MSECYPVETMPKEGHFLAPRGGDWLRVQRYESPFGHKDTVIQASTGRWWQASAWMPEPEMANKGPSELERDHD